MSEPSKKDKAIDFLIVALSTSESDTRRFLALVEKAEKILSGESEWEMQHRLEKIKERRNS